MWDGNRRGSPVALFIQPPPLTSPPPLPVGPPQNAFLGSASCVALVGVDFPRSKLKTNGGLSDAQARHIKNQIKASLAPATMAAASSFKGALPFLVLTTEEHLMDALQTVHQEAEGMLGMRPRMPVRGWSDGAARMSVVP